MVSLTSGCFDIHTAKRIFYPPDNTRIVMISKTIGEVKYDFQGPIDTFGRLQPGAAEFHREIDNFKIAPGGGSLYLWVQVHFLQATGQGTDFDRYLIITLSYLPEGGEKEVRIQRTYNASASTEIDVAEGVGNAIADPGIWSLKVEGVGTAVVSGGSTYYDWFRVTANGYFSSLSENNNSPSEGGTITGP
jgi:hypothetical protein